MQKFVSRTTPDHTSPTATRESTFAKSSVAKAALGVRVFVLEINGTAILAFETANMHEAMELSREAWLRDELLQLVSNHIPVWDSKAPIKTRTASAEEASIFKRSAKDGDTDDLRMVYLIEFDRAPIAGGSVSPGAFPPRR